MKRRLRLFCLVCCALLLPLFPATAAGTAQNIRVLLKRPGFTDRADLYLSGAYTVAWGGSEAAFRDGSRVTAQVRDGAIILYAGSVSFRTGTQAVFRRHASGAAQTGLRFVQDGNLYPGDLTLTVTGGQLQAVLTLSVEDYLPGVVPYEMSDSFPLEALKAQAVCARTYALSHIDPARAWDVTDTTADQVFHGVNAANTNAARAVRETAGVVCMSGGALAVCYYAASNGGRTELPGTVWGGRDNPVCYAEGEDPYDLANPESPVKRARLRKDGSGLPEAVRAALDSAMANAVKAKGFSEDPAHRRLSALTGVRVSGGILTVTASWSGRRYFYPEAEGEELYLLEPPTPAPGAPAPTPQLSGWTHGGTVTVALPLFPELIRSLNLSIGGLDNEIVTVVEEEQAFRLEARRYGHGVGMSQRGAQWMAAHHGMTFDRILAFYYPGSKLMVGGTEAPALPTLPAALYATPAPAASPTPRPTLMPVTGALPEGAWLASVEGIADDSSLNLRAEPNSAAEILMRLYKHQPLVVLEACEDPLWVHVRTDAAEGYVMVSFLEAVSNAN